MDTAINIVEFTENKRISVLDLSAGNGRLATLLMDKGYEYTAVLSNDNFREASEVYIFYIDGVRIIFLLSLTMVFIVLIAVSIWGLNSGQTYMGDSLSDKL